MNQIDTIRYMGIKTNLLEYIIPEIQNITPANGTVLDIMAGSNVVSYALKEDYCVYTNDIQKYSNVISNAIIVNQSETISSKSAVDELYDNYIFNNQNKEYDFFYKTYSSTYFSQKQCEDIDSIRFAIEKIDNIFRKDLYLFALMSAMCKVQSTPGHFAQYMPANHSRIIPLQKMNLYDEFIKKCDLYSNIIFSKHENHAYCMDYHDLLEKKDLNNVNTIYLDSPYTQEQYSRFYHILETVVKYDNPQVFYKAKYRNDRFQSSFCYRSKVSNEFESIFKYCNTHSTNLLISYSDKGLMKIDSLHELAKKYFKNTKLRYIDYKHSTQGKGSKELHEILISCSI